MHGLALAITLTLPLTPSPPLTRTRTLTNPNPNTRYGPLRLPMLLSGWAEAARLGWQEVLSPHISPASPLYLRYLSGGEARLGGGAREVYGRYNADIGET
jgi:hypothetical protein